jgi:hypothetical protein
MTQPGPGKIFAGFCDLRNLKPFSQENRRFCGDLAYAANP